MIKKNNILIGITGSIAAYKIADLISKLKKNNYDVKCVLTNSANKFITPTTVQTLSGNKVVTDNDGENVAIDHIDLIKWADIILIAPCTANFIAKAACGIANDVLSTLFLATNNQRPIVIAPAMNKEMLCNVITTNNINSLKKRGIMILPSPWGKQACGDVGYGRMMEPDDIIISIDGILKQEKIFDGTKILITAGPTLEYIDPVRFISNASSGKMGYYLAEKAIKLGADVTLITGPTSINTPNCRVKKVLTSDDMYQAVVECITKSDIFISAAAVSDYKPHNISQEKIKKKSEIMDLRLSKTKDILSIVSEQYSNKFIVGFAAETSNLEANAKAKLAAKNLDLIVANHVKVINQDDTELVLFDREMNKITLAERSKREAAVEVMKLIANLYNKNTSHASVDKINDMN